MSNESAHCLPDSIACQTDYHNNFIVHDGERRYHQNIPHYVQVGEHQFVEHTVIQMWINNMLVAW